MAVKSTADDISTLAAPLYKAAVIRAPQNSRLRAEPKPIPRLMFAGEATHTTYFSTMHGAYVSGLREAERLVEFYRDKNADETAASSKLNTAAARPFKKVVA